MQFFSFLQSLNRLDLVIFPILQGLFTYAFLQPFGENGILGTENVAAAFCFAVLTTLFCLKILKIVVGYMNPKKTPSGN